MRKPEKEIIKKLIMKGILKDTSILCVCAWKAERELFESLGFKNVTFTNINDSDTDGIFAPYKFETKNAMNLTYEHDSFDYVFVSNGLHHCSSPHRALLEMYRVAKKSIIVFENADSFLMRLAVRLKLTTEYEAVNLFSKQGYGGRNNTSIPNYIYRWTKREFEKAINSYYPIGKNEFIYYHGLDIPQRIERNKLLTILIKAILSIFPRSKNVFCAIATKPQIEEDIFQWIRDNVPDYKDLLLKDLR